MIVAYKGSRSSLPFIRFSWKSIEDAIEFCKSVDLYDLHDTEKIVTGNDLFFDGKAGQPDLFNDA
jgi:hypothetical protein